MGVVRDINEVVCELGKYFRHSVVVAVVRLTNGAMLKRLKAGAGQNHDE
jgi:hypothetical protein